ncbi:hypothetical protein F0562_015973 [Nyssa sinensis]|uniref:Uncharacterized protein n=1 Tax=Nyssa sinensis TaxID=561372 RepID=A0A5J4ZKH0_9ASTE|nr:hypothetical protein F0562_015973 [Nyssa sinensis]
MMVPEAWSWLRATPLYGATGTFVPVMSGDQTLTSLWPWVPRVDGDLDVGGEIIGGGDVEGEDGGVLKDEAWFPGLEDGPDDEEDEEEEDEVDNQKSSATLADTLPPPVLPVFGAPFFRHVLQRVRLFSSQDRPIVIGKDNAIDTFVNNPGSHLS